MKLFNTQAIQLILLLDVREELPLLIEELLLFLLQLVLIAAELKFLDLIKLLQELLQQLTKLVYHPQ